MKTKIPAGGGAAAETQTIRRMLDQVAKGQGGVTSDQIAETATQLNVSVDAVERVAKARAIQNIVSGGAPTPTITVPVLLLLERAEAIPLGLNQAAKKFDAGDLQGAIHDTRALLASAEEIHNAGPQQGRGGREFIDPRGTAALVAHASVLLGKMLNFTQERGEALAVLKKALTVGGRDSAPAVRLEMVNSYRALREFDKGAAVAQTAVHELERMPNAPAEMKSRGYFELAVMQKNAGDIGAATANMGKAYALRGDEHPATMIAYAGYLAMAGDTKKSDALLEKVKALSPSEPMQWLDIRMNMAWLSAVRGEKSETMGYMKEALAAAEPLGALPGLRAYFAMETDFDKFRTDPEFTKLVTG